MRYSRCIVYVSEAANVSVLEKLSQTLLGCDHSWLLHSFRDTVYNRTSFYIAGDSLPVQNAALNLCKEAFSLIDFGKHHGTHPTLGSVDNICFSPLGTETIENAASLARAFGSKLFDLVGAPVYFYGAASLSADNDVPIQLKSIRRQLGYFGDSGSLPVPNISPSYGLNKADSSKGISCIGAVPYIQNFNIRFEKEAPRHLVIKVTSSVRVPDMVEALTLEHEGGCFEVACNLRRPTQVDSAWVLSRAQEEAKSLGLRIALSYSTGPSEEELLRMLQEKSRSIS